MLSWFVMERYIRDALDQKILIDEKMVIKQCAQQHPAIGDDFNFYITKKYFSESITHK